MFNLPKLHIYADMIIFKTGCYLIELFFISFAQKLSLLENKNGEDFDFDGKFYSNRGILVDDDMVQLAMDRIDEIFEEANNVSRCGKNPKDYISISVGEFSDFKFQKFLSSCGKTDAEKETLRGIFNWRCILEKSDNACTSLDDVSLYSWGEYIECPGEPFVPLKSGFHKVIECLIESVPASKIRLNTEVTRVMWNEAPDSRGSMSVETKCGDVINCDHVLVTCSLGIEARELHYSAVSTFHRLKDTFSLCFRVFKKARRNIV